MTILETGSTPFVRNTAADQLADLAKQHPHDILNLVSRVYPFLFHKKWETRISAARAFGGIIAHVPEWDPNASNGESVQESQNGDLREESPQDEEGNSVLHDESCSELAKIKKEEDEEYEAKLKKILDTDEYEAILVSFKDWNLSEILSSGCTLLSTSDQNYDTFKSLGNDNSLDPDTRMKMVEFTKKIGFGETLAGVKSEIKSEAEVKSEGQQQSIKSPKVSARMRALAKRKAKLGNSKSIPVDITQSTISQQLSRNNSEVSSNPQSSAPIPDVDITSQQNGTKLVIENKPLQETVSSFAKFADHVWILQGVYELLIKSLFSPNWEVRHGSTLGLREMMKFKFLADSAGRVAGKSKSVNDMRNSSTLEDLVVRLLAIFAMDRFGDYISDTVVAPVRENAAQVLAAVLRQVNDSLECNIFKCLCDLIKQENVSKPCWEAKHGGLLGLRYFVSIKPELVIDNSNMLLETTNLVINCLRKSENDIDRDDDVQTVASAILLPITSKFVVLQKGLVKELLYVLWGCLVDLKDDLAAATGSVMDLLGRLCNETAVFEILHEMSSNEADDWNFAKLVPRLYPFLRHSLASVRKSVLTTLLSFIHIPDPSMHSWINGQIIRLIFQNLLMERNEDVLNLSTTVYDELINFLVKTGVSLEDAFEQHIAPLLDLMVTPIGLPRFNYSMNPRNILRPSGQSMSLSDIQLTGINYKKGIFSNISNNSNNDQKDEKKRKRKQNGDNIVSDNGNGHSDSNTSNSNNGTFGIPQSEYDLHINIDAPIINCDVTLVPLETIYLTRLVSARAMGRTISRFSNEEVVISFFTVLQKKLQSNFITARLLSCWIISEFFSSVVKEGKMSNVNYSLISQSISPVLMELLTTPTSSLPFFREIVPLLRSTRSHSAYLLSLFREQAHLSSFKLKSLAVLVTGEVDAGPGAFSISDANDLVNVWYGNAYKSLSAAVRISTGKALESARDRVKTSIVEVEDEYESRLYSVNSSIAGAYIRCTVFDGDGALPKKLNPIIRSLMDGVKLTNSNLIQKYVSKDVAYLISRLIQENRNNIAEKIVKNLCGFLCVDPAEVPEYSPNKDYDGILSLVREGRDANILEETAVVEDNKIGSGAGSIDFEIKGAVIKRKGGMVTLEALIKLFGDELFVKLPKFKAMMIEPMNNLNKNISELSAKEGQEIIDSFELNKTVFPWIDTKLKDEILSNVDVILKGLNSKESVFRYASSKCFASIVDSCPNVGFELLVKNILPMLNNPHDVSQRQGAVECIYHVVQFMDSSILPYIVFLIVPILGRMSDSNRDIRLIATATFAQIIKLVPLESGIPDPVDMPASLLEGRQKEREFLSQMMDPSKIEPFEMPVSIKATLRKYQQEGVNWLFFLNKYHLHGILCDDMGLGKTLQTICMVASDHHMRSEKFAKDRSIESRKLPSLIVCPPSLTGHWEQEFQQYAPFMKVIVYAGPPSARAQLKKQIENGVKDDIDIVITSYDIVRNDVDFVTKFDYNYCVLDEGHIIKNAKSVLSKCVKQVKAEHRLLLSGTPIQNNVVELWSLFDFLMPGFLGTYKQFDAKFAKPIASSRRNKGQKEQEKGALVLESLHKQVLPFMLRRLKEDVLADLPPKIIQDYYCELSNLQKQLYKDFINKQKKSIVKDIEETTGTGEDEEDVKGAKQHVFQVLQYMRKLCNHPSLVLTKSHPQYNEVSAYLKKYNMKLDDIEHAPKLLSLKNLLKECGIGLIGNESTVISQHRALVFCQMKDMLDIVENDLLKKNMPNVTYLRMDGSTDPRYRQSIVKQFNEDPSIDLLLLTTKVGGLGLNLTGADTVIFVEHDWNPMNDLQAMDRAHRLGQKRVVNVYRLITRDTLEEKIMGLQKFKMNIASSIVNQQNAGLASMDTHQLLDLFDSDKVGGESTEGDNNEKDSEASKKQKKMNGIDDVTDEGGLGGKAGTAVKELGELWDEKQYEEEYNLDSFIRTLK